MNFKMLMKEKNDMKMEYQLLEEDVSGALVQLMNLEEDQFNTINLTI
jgi:hypothetical protein